MEGGGVKGKKCLVSCTQIEIYFDSFHLIMIMIMMMMKNRIMKCCAHYDDNDWSHVACRFLCHCLLFAVNSYRLKAAPHFAKTK